METEQFTNSRSFTKLITKNKLLTTPLVTFQNGTPLSPENIILLPATLLLLPSTDLFL